MQRHRTVIILAIALALSIPTFAAAEWAGRGFYEPDTQLDREGLYNFADPDTDPDADRRQVYFSAYVVQNTAQHNPNLAFMGSNHIASPSTNFNAFLGVWKDCNNDGYIGMLDTVVLEYRAELLMDNSICPAATSAHNDGEWVSEFIWIGPDEVGACGGESDPEADTTPLNIADDCARVWGDIGTPTDQGAITCPLIGWSRGTFQSTGGLIRYADCIATYRIYSSVNTVADATDADEAAGIQLDMHDVPRERPDQSGSIVNQKNPYGNPGGDSAVTVWDCSDPTVVSDPTGGDLRRISVTDPTGGDLSGPQDIFVGTLTLFDAETHERGFNVTGEDGTIASFNNPVVPTVNPAGSPAGTVNETLEGTEDCDRSEGAGWDSDIYDQWLETDFEPSSPVRRDHDVTMVFYEGFTGCIDLTPDQVDPAETCALGANQPDSLGLAAYRDLASGDSIWYGTIAYTASRNGWVNIDDFTPQKAQYFTFYAYVSNEVLGTQGLTTSQPAYSLYGADHCDGIGTITGYWDCNAANWWLDGTGNSIKSAWEVAVGQQFNLRDIDCYDETYTRDQDETTTHALSGTSCDR